MTDEINQWQLAIPVIEQVKRGERKRVIEEVRELLRNSIENISNPRNYEMAHYVMGLQEAERILTELEAGAE
jgi:hypothetical protein